MSVLTGGCQQQALAADKKTGRGMIRGLFHFVRSDCG
jgi:hypothetical protein